MWDDEDLPPFVEATELPRVKIGQLARLFEASQTPYAFGGAIALGYAGEPRGSWDIDVCVFVPDAEALGVLHTVSELIDGIHHGRALGVVQRDGQVRIDWEGTLVDLFFSYDPFHDALRERSLRVDFDGTVISVLTAEDLVILKVLADRERDWADIENVLRTRGGRFDYDYVRHWLQMVCGANPAKPRHFDSAVVAAGAA